MMVGKVSGVADCLDCSISIVYSSISVSLWNASEPLFLKQIYTSKYAIYFIIDLKYIQELFL